MADTFTKKFQWGKPEIGSARNRWGHILNDTLDAIDEVCEDLRADVDNAVKRTGDAMTGSLTFADNSEGIIFSADTRAFDATGGTKSAHYIDLAGDTLHIRTEDGSADLLTVTATGIAYKGKSVLYQGDGSYLPTSGGKVTGSVVVTGDTRTGTLHLDDDFGLVISGKNCLTLYADGAQTGFNRDTKGYTWTSGGVIRMTLDGAGSLTVPGDITGYSDARLKTDIQQIDGALDLVKAIRGVTFTRKADGSRSLGVIAQEVEAVLPEAVRTDADGMRSVAYGNLTGVLVEAVKVLAAKVEWLEARK